MISFRRARDPAVLLFTLRDAAEDANVGFVVRMTRRGKLVDTGRPRAMAGVLNY